MSNFNKVILMGNLTRDPELKNLGSGTALCEIGMATNRKFKTQSGEMKEETCFIDITLWGRMGENLHRYLKKGDPVLIEGRLKFDTWETPEGQKRSKLSVVAEGMQFVPRGGTQQGQDGQQQSADPFADQRPSDVEVPF